MNPLLFVLLRNICFIESIAKVEQLLEIIINDTKDENYTIALFVAAYYATASTRVGHMAAGHGPGLSSINRTIATVEGYNTDQIDRNTYSMIKVNVGEDVLLFQ